MSGPGRVFVNTEGDRLQVSDEGMVSAHCLAALGWQEEGQPAPPSPAPEAPSIPAEVAVAGAPESAGGALAKPKGSASRGEWAAYAAAQGIEPDGLTREQLREAVAMH